MKTSHGLAMDGFLRGSATGVSSQRTAHKITEASNLLNPKKAGTRIKSAAQGVHQRAQRSQALMRSAVKKPSLIKARSPVRPKGQKQQNQPLSHNIDTNVARASRVQSIIKNTKVHRFGHVTKPMPAGTQTLNAKKTVIQQAAASKTTGSVVLYKPLPSMLSSTSNRQLERMLDEALIRADAHKKALSGRLNPNLWQKIKLTPRWLSIGVAFFAVALLGGFLALHKVPQVEMRVAAAKAHVDAQVPGYTPSGFSLANPIQTAPGSVTVKYKANGDSSRTFTLTQEASDMDSRSLSDSVIPRNTQVQTSSVNGTTVYIYGVDNDATWVDHGMKYQISDSAALNSDQLLKIANSL